MKKRLLSLALAAIMALGLAVPAMAYTTPDFSDVPSNHWAYQSVMKMADAGVIKGTGGGMFSPDMKLSAEMFIVLVGRVVFPDVKAEGADWSGPYVAEAKAKGLLEGTNITDSNLKGDISRYDMAVILAKCVDLLKVSATKADSSKVTDYGEVPAKYIDAVLMAYGSGLIRGDQSGNFNGANSMTRQEAATVMDRLLALTPGGSTVTPDTDPEKPTDAAYTLAVLGTAEIGDTLVLGEKILIYCGVNPVSAAPDLSGIVCTSSNPAVAVVTREDKRNWYLTAVSEGTVTITMTDPYGVTGSKEFKVVAAREDLGTKTYAVQITIARQERHTLRGAAYTEMDFLENVPYKIYYTRDGEISSQVVYEGVASDYDRIEIELPEDAFYGKDAGLYISGEAMLDGQRLVTSDLRTDGRAYPGIVYKAPEASASSGLIPRMEFLLAPPTGEKAKFTIRGGVVYGLGGTSYVGEGFTVQLHLKDGRVVGEAITDTNGQYTLNCEVDAIDNGFDAQIEQYYVTANGIHDGVKMECNGRRSSGELALYSSDFMGGNPDSKLFKNVYWGIEVSPTD